MVDFKTLPYARAAKLIFTGAVLAACWLYLFWSANAALDIGHSREWLTPILLLTAAVPLTALAAVIFGPKSYFLLTAAMALASLVFFPANLYSLLGAALVFFGFWRAYHRAQFELHNNIKFAPSHIVRQVGSIILLAFMLTIAFQVYARVSADIRNDESGFYARLSMAVTHGVLPIIERQIPGFDQALTLDQFIVNGFTESLPNFGEMPPETRRAQLAQSRSELAKSLGIVVSGEEPLSQVAQLAVESQIREIIDNFTRQGLPVDALLPAVYALAIFSLMRIFGYFVSLAAEILSVPLFWVLRVARFIRVTTTQILAEQVEI